MNSRHTAHLRWSSRSSMPAGAPGGAPAAPRGGTRAAMGPGAASIASRLRLTPWRARGAARAPPRHGRHAAAGRLHSRPMRASAPAPGPGQCAARPQSGMNMRDLSGAGGVSAWGMHDASVTQARSGAVRGVCRAALRGRVPATLGRRARLLGRPRGLLLAREAVARVIVLRDARARSRGSPIVRGAGTQTESATTRLAGHTYGAQPAGEQQVPTRVPDANSSACLRTS